MSLFIFVYAIFYTILSRFRLDLAVFLIIVALPSYLLRFKFFGIPFTALELMILISFAVWFIFYTKFKEFIKGKYSFKQFKENRKKRLSYPFELEIILLLLISYLAVIFAGLSDNAMGIWKAYFFEPVLLFIVVLNVFNPSSKDGCSNKGGVIKMLWALAVSAFVVSVFAVYQKFTGFFIPNELWAAKETRRVTSFFGYPNAVGLYLGPIILLLTGFFASRLKQFDLKNKLSFFKNFFLGLTIVLSLLAVYFAKSEGALIGVATGWLVFGLLGKRKLKLITIAFSILVVLTVFAYAPARDYASKKITLNDYSGQIRKQQWKETWQMLGDGRFFVGSGLANYQESVEPYHEAGIYIYAPELARQKPELVASPFFAGKEGEVWQGLEIYLYPHNIFLNFWTELGLAGLLLFVWIIIKYFVASFKNFKSGQKFIASGLIAAMVSVLVHGLVDVPYFKNDLSVLFWLMIAMVSLINLCLNKPGYKKIIIK